MGDWSYTHMTPSEKRLYDAERFFDRVCNDYLSRTKDKGILGQIRAFLRRLHDL
jgi:hypothetical protein